MTTEGGAGHGNEADKVLARRGRCLAEARVRVRVRGRGRVSDVGDEQD